MIYTEIDFIKDKHDCFKEKTCKTKIFILRLIYLIF